MHIHHNVSLATKPWTKECLSYPQEAFKQKDEITARIILVSEKDEVEDIRKKVEQLNISPWQLKQAFSASDEVVELRGENGPCWICKPKGFALAKNTTKSSPLFNPYQYPYAKMRELGGVVVAELQKFQPDSVVVEKFSSIGENEAVGFLAGLNLGAHRLLESKRPKPMAMSFEGFSEHEIMHGQYVAHAQNVSRHLVNLPPTELNPESIADYIQESFQDDVEFKIETIVGEDLKTQGLHLLYGVGQAATNAPRLVILRYQPTKSHRQKRVVIVGKGVTFDTGGLDLKPADGMRLMKKDMGGASAVIGFAQYLKTTKPDFPCDMYLAFAENAINHKAYKPSDVIKSLSGTNVEIHNTDAEGRLVMADAMTRAMKDIPSDKIQCLIDVSTLTGAIKLALGTKLAGLFSNHDVLARAVVGAGNDWADPSWRMPLFEGYKNELRSSAADMTNASSSRFGGAITAALFLSHFVKDTPWAHLDIYSWVDAPFGPFREDGGSGQGVGTLIGLTRSSEIWF